MDYSDLIIQNISDDYNFDPILKRATENLLSDISNLGYVDSLAQYLSKSEDETLTWLNDLFQEVKNRSKREF